MSPEEEQEIKNDMGIEPWEEGRLMLMPEQVECAFCKKKFQVIPPV